MSKEVLFVLNTLAILGISLVASSGKATVAPRSVFSRSAGNADPALASEEEEEELQGLNLIDRFLLPSRSPTLFDGKTDRRC